MHWLSKTRTQKSLVFFSFREKRLQRQIPSSSTPLYFFFRSLLPSIVLSISLTLPYLFLQCSPVQYSSLCSLEDFFCEEEGPISSCSSLFLAWLVSHTCFLEPFYIKVFSPFSFSCSSRRKRRSITSKYCSGLAIEWSLHPTWPPRFFHFQRRCWNDDEKSQR